MERDKERKREGRLCKTKINEIGTYSATLNVGDQQSIIFEHDLATSYKIELTKNVKVVEEIDEKN